VLGAREKRGEGNGRSFFIKLSHSSLSCSDGEKFQERGRIRYDHPINSISAIESYELLGGDSKKEEGESADFSVKEEGRKRLGITHALLFFIGCQGGMGREKNTKKKKKKTGDLRCTHVS